MVKILPCISAVVAVVQDYFSTNWLNDYSDTSEIFFYDLDVPLIFLTTFFFPPQLSISD